MKLTTYVNFGGNCEEAFRFYEEHIGAKILSMMKHGELPPEAGNQIEGWQDKVLYATLEIGGTMISGNDVPPEKFAPMRAVYLTLNSETKEETERLYNVLSEGGTIYQPLQAMFFSPAWAMFRDKFGVSWMLLTHPQQ